MHLLQHFKELSLHPKNAKELKGLILQLALRGRLTNDLNMGYTEGEAKDQIEGFYKLPKGWYWDKFDNLVDFQMGKTPPSKENQYWEGKIPWISIADMETYGTIIETKRTISELGLKNYFKNTKVKKGTLIMSFKLTIGKTSILGEDACHNEAIISIYPYQQILQDYLFLFLPIISNSGIQVSALMGKTLNKGKIQNLKVPVPPLQEQKTIVNIVNQLFKEVDELEQQTKARIQLKEDFVTSALRQLSTGNTTTEWTFLQDHFKTFFTEQSAVKKLRKSILQLAVQGKLTAHWRIQNPDLEDASILLERIKEEKAQLVKDKKIKKEKPLLEITKDEIPSKLPEGWVWCRMQEVGLFERGKSKHRPRNDFRLFADGNYPLVQTGDVSGAKKNGGVINTHKSAYNDFGLAQSRMWKKGTLCITIAANIAETGFLGFDACFPDSVVGFSSLLDNYVSQYVEYFVTVMKSDLEKYAPSTAQKNINLGILYELKFPLPPLSEIKPIVEIVNTLMGLCDQFEGKVQKNKATQEDWMKSSLREVFEK